MNGPRRAVLLASLLASATAGAATASAGPAVLYVNFSDGSESLSKGATDDAARNLSSIIGAPRYPPFSWPGLTDGLVSRRDLIRTVIRNVDELFLPYNVLVTTTRPASGPYTMVMVGGSPTLIDPKSTLAGVAFMDCGNAEPSNIVFAFPTALRGNVHGLVVTIAQEAAHAFGLEHSMDRTDIMYPRVDPMQASFPDRETAIEGTPLCGRMTQNPHRRLLETLGSWPGGDKPRDDGGPPDQDPPVIVIREPAAGSEVRQPFTLRATVQDDSTIDRVTVMAGAGSLTATRGPYLWSLAGLPAGPLTVKVTAVDAAGNLAETTLALTVTAEEGGCSVSKGGSRGADLLLVLLCLTRLRTCRGHRGRL